MWYNTINRALDEKYEFKETPKMNSHETPYSENTDEKKLSQLLFEPIQTPSFHYTPTTNLNKIPHSAPPKLTKDIDSGYEKISKSPLLPGAGTLRLRQYISELQIRNSVLEQKLKKLEKSLNREDELNSQLRVITESHNQLALRFNQQQQDMLLLKQCLEQKGINKTIEEIRGALLHEKVQQLEHLSQQYDMAVKDIQLMKKELERTKGKGIGLKCNLHV